MLTKFTKMILQMIAGANITSSLLLLLSCWSVYLVPENWPRLSLFGLTFPFFVIINLLFLFWWLIFYIRYIWIPAVALLLSAPFIYDYAPVNLKTTPPEGALKVLTYNVAFFGGSEESKKKEENAILNYIVQSDADIVCLQEASGPVLSLLNEKMKQAGYYVPKVVDTGKELLEHSYFKMPVLSVEPIKYDSKTNGSVAYHLLYEGDTLLVINNHLESNRLTAEDKSMYKSMIFDPQKENMENGIRLLMRKMALASEIRSPQVDIIQKYIKRDRSSAVIVCGDFNDSPISYTCNRFGKNLVSSFVESGNGPGFSYNKDLFYVRIDHIFHSKNLKSYASQIDRSIKTSDHYPLITYIDKDKMGTKD